jgi:hypothetical protein
VLLIRIAELLRFELGPAYCGGAGDGAVHWASTVVQRAAALDVLCFITQIAGKEDAGSYAVFRVESTKRFVPALFLGCVDGDEATKRLAMQCLRLALERNLLEKKDLESSRQTLEVDLDHHGATDRITRLRALEL